jgi:SAM-dependent methyltransferase
MIRELFWTIKKSVKKLLKFPETIWKYSQNLIAWKNFWHSYYTYTKLADTEEKPLVKYLYPCLGDDTEETPIEPIYFYQDTWAFEKIIKQNPCHHYDVGSQHKFVAFLSKVLPVTMVDIRPLSLSLDTLNFKKGSILELPFADESIDSLSSLCVVEHIGLGRYGDSLDPKGTEKAIVELKRVIKSQGHLYLSIPIDDETRTYFNAHRAFKEDYLYELFYPFEILESRYIYDKNFLKEKISGFGIGLYHLYKK